MIQNTGIQTTTSVYGSHMVAVTTIVDDQRPMRWAPTHYVDLDGHRVAVMTGRKRPSADEWMEAFEMCQWHRDAATLFMTGQHTLQD